MHRATHVFKDIDDTRPEALADSAAQMAEFVVGDGENIWTATADGDFEVTHLLLLLLLLLLPLPTITESNFVTIATHHQYE